jgi:hypothetical protein
MPDEAVIKLVGKKILPSHVSVSLSLSVRLFFSLRLCMTVEHPDPTHILALEQEQPMSPSCSTLVTWRGCGCAAYLSRSMSPPSRPAFCKEVKICPDWEFGPTAVTTIRPCPSTTLLPERRIGAKGPFETSSDSPVNWLSSTLPPAVAQHRFSCIDISTGHFTYSQTDTCTCRQLYKHLYFRTCISTVSCTYNLHVCTHICMYSTHSVCHPPIRTEDAS